MTNALVVDVRYLIATGNENYVTTRNSWRVVESREPYNGGGGRGGGDLDGRVDISDPHGPTIGLNQP